MSETYAVDVSHLPKDLDEAQFMRSAFDPMYEEHWADLENGDEEEYTLQVSREEDVVQFEVS